MYLYYACTRRRKFMISLLFWRIQVSYLRWLETLFEKCKKNGFEHDIVDYYRILKGKEYHSGMKK